MSQSTLSVMRGLAFECAECAAVFTEPAWMIVDALEMPTVATDPKALFQIRCSVCGTERVSRFPVLITRLHPRVPLIVVLKSSAESANSPDPVLDLVDERIDLLERQLAGQTDFRDWLPALWVEEEIYFALVERQADASILDDLRPAGPGDETLIDVVKRNVIERDAACARRRLLTTLTLDGLAEERNTAPWSDQDFYHAVLADLQEHQDLDSAVDACLVALTLAMHTGVRLPEALSSYLDQILRWQVGMPEHEQITLALRHELDDARAAGDPRLIAYYAGRMFDHSANEARGNPVMQLEGCALLEEAVSAALIVSDRLLLSVLRSQLAALLSDSLLPDRDARLVESLPIYIAAIADAEAAENLDELAVIQGNLASTIIKLTRLDRTYQSLLPLALQLAGTALSYNIENSTRENQGYSYAHKAFVELNSASESEDLPTLTLAIDDYVAALSFAEDIPDPNFRAVTAIDLAQAEMLAHRLGEPNRLWAGAQRLREVSEDSTVNEGIRGRAYAELAQALVLGGAASDEVFKANHSASSLIDYNIEPSLFCSAAMGAGLELAGRAEWITAARLFDRIDILNKTLRERRRDDSMNLRLSRANRSFDEAPGLASYCYAKAMHPTTAVEIIEASRCEFIGRSSREENAVLTNLALRNRGLVDRYIAAREAAHVSPMDERGASARSNLSAETDNIREAGFTHFLQRHPFDDLSRATSSLSPMVYLLSCQLGSVCFIVTGPHAQLVHTLMIDDLSATDIENWIQTHQEPSVQASEDWLSTASTARATLRRVLPKLGEILMRPLCGILEELRPRQVTLIPTGRLAEFPLHAAPFKWDKRNVVALELFPIQYLPAAAFLVNESEVERRSAVPRQLVAFAYPTAGARRLNGAVKESVAAFNLYPGQAQVLFNAAATSAAVVQQIQSPCDLHVACHAARMADDPAVSLLLSDRPLSLDDLATIGRNLPLRVVFASGCGTGQSYLPSSPNEALSLTTAFLNVGATGVVSSMWPVHDSATALLVYKFYESRVLHGSSPAEALQQAALWLRSASPAELRRLRKKMRLPRWLVSGLSQGADRMDDIAVETSSARGIGDWWRHRTSSLGHPYDDPIYWAAMTYSGS